MASPTFPRVYNNNEQEHFLMDSIFPISAYIYYVREKPALIVLIVATTIRQPILTCVSLEWCELVMEVQRSSEIQRDSYFSAMALGGRGREWGGISMAPLKWCLLSGSQDMSSGRGRAGSTHNTHNTNDSASFLIFVNMNLDNSTPHFHHQRGILFRHYEFVLTHCLIVSNTNQIRPR